MTLVSLAQRCVRHRISPLAKKEYAALIRVLMKRPKIAGAMARATFTIGIASLSPPLH